MRNQRGQFLVEGILIMVFLVATMTFVASTFRQDNFLAQLVESPWQRLAGMLQNGAWVPPAQSMALHPSNHGRHITVRGITD